MRVIGIAVRARHIVVFEPTKLPDVREVKLRVVNGKAFTEGEHDRRHVLMALADAAARRESELGVFHGQLEARR